MQITLNELQDRVRRIVVETDYGTHFEFAFVYAEYNTDATLANVRVYFVTEYSPKNFAASFAPWELEQAQNMAVLLVHKTLTMTK